MEESTGEEGLRRIRAELMQGCASAMNFRPAAVQGLLKGILRVSIIAHIVQHVCIHLCMGVRHIYYREGYHA